jgi:hypothetical protein
MDIFMDSIHGTLLRDCNPDFSTVHFPRKETLKVFSANRESAKEKETFRVFVYGRETLIIVLVAAPLETREL